MKFSAALVAPIIVLIALLSLVVIAGVHRTRPLPLPECQFYKIVGVPCVACRGTRSLGALASGRPIAAFLLNPAAIIGLALGVGWGVMAVIRRGRPLGWRCSPLTVGWLVGAMLVLNWIYLVVSDYRYQ